MLPLSQSGQSAQGEVRPLGGVGEQTRAALPHRSRRQNRQIRSGYDGHAQQLEWRGRLPIY